MEDFLENWIKEIEEQNAKPNDDIDITDGILVEFSNKQQLKTFNLVVKNETANKVTIKNVSANVETITVVRNYNGVCINPDASLKLYFDIVRKSNEIAEIAKVYIYFENKTVSRNVKIIYTPNVYARSSRTIRQGQYEIPNNLTNLMRAGLSVQELEKKLDELIPTVDDLNFENYPERFHQLLYLEELSHLKNFGIYTRNDVHFSTEGDNYKMNVENLFETRPSLQTANTTSWCNKEEALQIQHFVTKLVKFGINPADIGVISPYNLQVRMLKFFLNEKHGLNVTVGTVEEFQGHERLIILLSTVRTCRASAKLDIKRRLGFIHCPKRLNVAVSRARALFMVVGSARLLSTDDKWKTLIDECRTKGTLHGMDSNLLVSDEKDNWRYDYY